MPNDKCSTKRCRGEIALIYLGKPLCQDCYNKICDKEEQCLTCKEFNPDGDICTAEKCIYPEV